MRRFVSDRGRRTERWLARGSGEGVIANNGKGRKKIRVAEEFVITFFFFVINLEGWEKRRERDKVSPSVLLLFSSFLFLELVKEEQEKAVRRRGKRERELKERRRRSFKL